MERDAALEILRRHRLELQNRGIAHAAIFGSTARGDTHAASDVDIMIDLDENAAPDVYAYVGLCHFIADLFPVAVDVADRRSLKPRVREWAERDAIPAF